MKTLFMIVTIASLLGCTTKAEQAKEIHQSMTPREYEKRLLLFDDYVKTMPKDEPVTLEMYIEFMTTKDE